jgi:DNA modification methylase
MKEAGFKIAECLIWEKNAFVMGRQDYHWRHEPILYGWKEGAGHYFIKDRTQDTVMLEDDIDFESMKKAEIIAWIEQRARDNKDLTTVLFENKPHRSDLHPTMKPLELIGRLMLNSSKPGWIAADFFMGRGSTLMAAEQLGRTAYGMEMGEKFCDVIIKRWEEFTGQKAVKIDG